MALAEAGPQQRKLQDFVTLCRPQSEVESGHIAALLESSGIHCVVRRLSMWELDGVAHPAYGAWGEIWVNPRDSQAGRDVLEVLRSPGPDPLPEEPEPAALVAEAAQATRRWLILRKAFLLMFLASLWIDVAIIFVQAGLLSPTAGPIGTAVVWVLVAAVLTPITWYILRVLRMKGDEGYLQ
jgi:hypothetical protein